MERVERKYWNGLLEIKDLKLLEEIYIALEIECLPETTGKANLLLKILFRYFNSVDLQNSEDQGWSTFLELEKRLFLCQDTQNYITFSTTWSLYEWIRIPYSQRDIQLNPSKQ